MYYFGIIFIIGKYVLGKILGYFGYRLVRGNVCGRYRGDGRWIGRESFKMEI